MVKLYVDKVDVSINGESYDSILFYADDESGKPIVLHPQAQIPVPPDMDAEKLISNPDEVLNLFRALYGYPNNFKLFIAMCARSRIYVKDRYRIPIVISDECKAAKERVDNLEQLGFYTDWTEMISHHIGGNE